MIGNDIVDLAQAKLESNWRRRGYLDKIFTPHEQQIIHKASDPDQLVWLLWSMKESTYKLAVRATNKRVFAPIKIACSLQESTSGIVNGTVVYDEMYQTKSVVTPQYISTVAFATNEAPACKQVIVSFETTDHKTHQRVIRQRIKQQYRALSGIPTQEINIYKNETGAPSMVVGQTTFALSISHHGHYGAFVIPLTIFH